MPGNLIFRSLLITGIAISLFACRKRGNNVPEPDVPAGQSEIFLAGLSHIEGSPNSKCIQWDVAGKTVSQTFIHNNTIPVYFEGVWKVQKGSTKEVYFYGLKELEWGARYRLGFYNASTEFSPADRFAPVMHHEEFLGSTIDPNTNDLYLTMSGRENGGAFNCYYYKITPAQQVTRHLLPDWKFNYGVMQFTGKGLNTVRWDYVNGQIEADVELAGTAGRHVNLNIPGHEHPRIIKIHVDEKENVYILYCADAAGTTDTHHFMSRIKKGSNTSDLFALGQITGEDLLLDGVVNNGKWYIGGMEGGASKFYYLVIKFPEANDTNVQIDRNYLELSNEWELWGINKPELIGGSVYIPGSRGNKACYWVDGKLKMLETTGFRTSGAWIIYTNK